LISRFFIDRPIFATVLSIVITLAGVIAWFFLPLALYPPISPPNVSVDCNYPGASAQVVSETVATPIEQQVNGVEDMMYMSSQCTNDGTYNLTVTFKHGIDLNMAQVLVQNRVALALPMLPDVIKQTGVSVRKRAPDILLVVAITSPDNRYDQLYLSNYALMHMKDELARLPGVSDVTMLGQRDYSMRIWLDPEKLASRSMTAGDVVRAVREQNMQLATGQIGQPPAPPGQAIQIPLNVAGRLVEAEQFAEMAVKVGPEGRVTRLKDVARVELAPKNQDISGQVNGKPCCSLAVFQLPDANALDVAVVVKKKIKQLESEFPPGVMQEIRYDTTPYIDESLHEVWITLLDAVILVAVVVLLFLQNWRSALIPLLAVPVAIIGTLAVMAAFGFSLNNLTLFGLVLAIGIVVDDAIVVVEAVEHHIETGLSPRDATIRAMEQVSGPVIAIGLVLSAVFVPCAFISGIVGQFFRQFALTIATSTIISAFNSLTLSPALAAVLLRPREDIGSKNVLPRLVYAIIGGWVGWVWLTPHLAPRLGDGWPGGPWAPYGMAAAAGAIAAMLIARPVNFVLWEFFRVFNAAFKASTRLYGRLVAGMLRVSVLVILVYVGLVGLTYYGFISTPNGFIPSQDMGYLLINVQLPDSTSTERTQALMTQIEKMAKRTPGIKHTQAMTGQSMLLSANGSNFGSMFTILDDFSKRPNPVLDRFFTWYDDTVTTLDLRLEGLYRGLGERYERFDLLLMSSQGSVSNIPTSGKALVVVANVDGVLYFRVFDADGNLRVNRDETSLTTQAGPIADLKKQLESLQLPHKLTRSEMDRVNAAVTSIVGHSRYQLRLRPRIDKRKRPYLTFDPVEVPLPFRSTLRGWIGQADNMDRLHQRAYPTILDPKTGQPVVPSPSYVETRVRRWLRQPKQVSLYGDAIANSLRMQYADEDAMITVLGPPPVRGVGRAGGFKVMIEDRGDNGPSVLQNQTENLNDRCKDQQELVGMTSVFRANVPQIFVDVDRQACMSRGVTLQDNFDTMRVYLGSLYVNDFNRFGRTWQVIVQADPQFRNKVEDVRRLKVRNTEGTMVPVGTLAEVREVNGPLVLTRYNMYPAAPLNGAAAPGVSSGEAIRLVEGIANDPKYGLPKSMHIEWTELAYLELLAGNTAMVIFGLAVVMVFLVLAAQYESWSLPLAVILVVPMCLLSAILGVNISYQDINIFTQIGFVVLVGLASKNAILIVEFAKHRREEGESRTQAALDACALRLRPIVMTSVAFILGVLPLILSQGAGAEMRHTLGTTVFCGMLGVTIFGIFLTPVFFVVIDWLGDRPAFHAGPVMRVSAAVLWVLSFRWLSLLMRPFVVRPRRPSAPTPLEKQRAPEIDAPSHQGNGNGNGQVPAGAEEAVDVEP
jgi:multidrug efflux pump subunit AcrB